MRHRLVAIALAMVPSLAAQTWQALPGVPVDLAFPVVVELRGNIHVIGGGAPGGATDLHLRYTPATNTWDSLPPVPYLAQQPAGAVVNDRIHYCGGGYPNTGTRLDDHYFFDPDSSKWFQAASMTVPTAIHEAASFNGRLYVFSGQPNKTLCEYYDPADSLWHTCNPLPDPNFWYGAIVSTGNTIYRFGGGGFVSPQTLAHQYNALADSWTPITSLPMALHAVAGARFDDSLIVLSGGYNVFETDKVWIYSTSSDSYVESDPLPIARDYHAMVAVDTCVYSVGGNNGAIPNVGVSLIRNCNVSQLTPSLVAHDTVRPFTVVATPKSFLVRLSGRAGSGRVQVVDMNGRVVRDQAIDHELRLESRHMAAGTYAVSITTAGQQWLERWVAIPK